MPRDVKTLGKGQPPNRNTMDVASLERQPLVATPARNSRPLKAVVVATLACGALLLGARVATTAPAPALDAQTELVAGYGAPAWTPTGRCVEYSNWSEKGCEMCGWAEPPTYYEDVAAKYPAAARACANSANASATNPLPATRPLPGSSHTHGPSNAWYKACLWEALADLPAVCAGTFVPTPPPAVPAATTHEEYTCDCELHAYCFSGCGPGGGDNKYCAAYFAQHPHLDYFDWASGGPRPMPSLMGNVGPEQLWREEPFWCDARTLAAIEGGYFAPAAALYSPVDRAYLNGVDGFHAPYYAAVVDGSGDDAVANAALDFANRADDFQEAAQERASERAAYQTTAAAAYQAWHTPPV